MEYIVYVLAGIIVIQAIIHRRERKDLINRIMSRDVYEYKAVTQNKPRAIKNTIRKRANGS
jgi:hypothetical protein